MNGKYIEHILGKSLGELLNIKPILISGPCAVESIERTDEIAGLLAALGIRLLRGGAFKPRTCPKSFQGLGLDGLKILRQIADKYNMFTVSEILESKQIEQSYDLIDIIQIGSRNMTSYGLLKEIGKASARDAKPVLLKRSYNSTLREFVMASEYISGEGNPNVVLCLRGIRTFEQIDSQMRFTPDLAGIIELKDMTSLPVIFDPSHAAGNSKYVLQLARAALFMGADGIMLESHTNPGQALSDGKQAVSPQEIGSIINFIDLMNQKEKL